MSASRIVLDGELIVWNKTRGVFEPFGGLRSTMNAANQGVAADHVSGGRLSGGAGDMTTAFWGRADGRMK